MSHDGCQYNAKCLQTETIKCRKIKLHEEFGVVYQGYLPNDIIIVCCIRLWGRFL